MSQLDSPFLWFLKKYIRTVHFLNGKLRHRGAQPHALSHSEAESGGGDAELQLLTEALEP